MSKRVKFTPPAEGADTLVTQFSVSEFWKVVEKIKSRVEPEFELDAAYEWLANNLAHAPSHLKDKLALVACGQTPPDDFSWKSIVAAEFVDEWSVRLDVSGVERELGDLVYFQRQSWIVVARKKSRFLLKRTVSQ